MDISTKNDKTKLQKIASKEDLATSSEIQSISSEDITIEDICDENLLTLNKIHAILLNCSNLSKKQKLEFCESERYFMKLFLKKLRSQNNLK
ncbi:MAG: hypothetical protein ACFFEY_03735 [Candidatus Thorarchaeota archaeon]